MKNLLFLLCSLFSLSIACAQTTHESNTSITVSDDDESFSIEAYFSRSLPKSVKAEIIESLGKPTTTSKQFIWEKEKNGDLAYKFQLGKKNCSVFLDKNLLSQDQFDDLFDLGNEILELLEEDKKNNASTAHTAPKPPKPPKTPKREKDHNTKKNTKIELHFDDDANKQYTASVSITDEEEVFSLSARFSRSISKELYAKIEKGLDVSPVKKSSTRYTWEEKKNGERAYRFNLGKKTCKIFIDKNLVTGNDYQQLLDLANEIINYIKGE